MSTLPRQRAVLLESDWPYYAPMHDPEHATWPSIGAHWVQPPLPANPWTRYAADGYLHYWTEGAFGGVTPGALFWDEPIRSVGAGLVEWCSLNQFLNQVTHIPGPTPPPTWFFPDVIAGVIYGARRETDAYGGVHYRGGCLVAYRRRVSAYRATAPYGMPPGWYPKSYQADVFLVSLDDEADNEWSTWRPYHWARYPSELPILPDTDPDPEAEPYLAPYHAASWTSHSPNSGQYLYGSKQIAGCWRPAGGQRRGQVFLSEECVVDVPFAYPSEGYVGLYAAISWSDFTGVVYEGRGCAQILRWTVYPAWIGDPPVYRTTDAVTGLRFPTTIPAEGADAPADETERATQRLRPGVNFARVDEDVLYVDDAFPYGLMFFFDDVQGMLAGTPRNGAQLTLQL